MGPFGEGHFDHQHGHGDHHVDDIDGVGRQRQFEQPARVDQNPGKGRQPQQDEKGPIRGVAVCLKGLACLERSPDGDGRTVKDGKRGIITQHAYGMPERIDLIALEPADADDHQGKDDRIAGHDQEVIDPLDILGPGAAGGEFLLSEELQNEFFGLTDIDRQGNPT